MDNEIVESLSGFIKELIDLKLKQNALFEIDTKIHAKKDKKDEDTSEIIEFIKIVEIMYISKAALKDTEGMITLDRVAKELNESVDKAIHDVSIGNSETYDIIEAHVTKFVKLLFEPEKSKTPQE